MSTISRIPLNPRPGFCFKSKTLTDEATTTASTASLGSSSTVTGAKGLKIFINIAWDANVPPPPSGSEDAIQKAMHGHDFDDGWFVPVLVSNLREVKDRAGQPSLVVDCVFNTTIESRSLKDPDFKAFIIELSIQRVEAQTSLLLSRQIGFPNISSKGKPESRHVLVPSTLYPPGHPHYKSDKKSNLIQELDSQTSAPSVPRTKGKLKSKLSTLTPTWTWTKSQSKIRIVIDVPNVTHADVPNSTLDVEPRRVMLRVPSLYDLDINLDASDDDPISNHELLRKELKTFRDLDVDGARAEWHVSEKVILLLV